MLLQRMVMAGEYLLPKHLLQEGRGLSSPKTLCLMSRAGLVLKTCGLQTSARSDQHMLCTTRKLFFATLLFLIQTSHELLFIFILQKQKLTPIINSARHATKGIHCVGTATSTVVLGPYKPQESPIACHFSAGGSIDPSGFTDVDGTHYVVYKIDGNSVGHGGSCGNTVEPIVSTPLMLQQLKADGITPVGAPIQVLDRGEYDGPLIEAPSLLYYEGVYFLFFSSNCYSTTLYDVSYATASSVKGPFTKSAKPLMVTDNPFTITAPGGATVTVDGKNLVFHANCDHGRCMFERSIKISGKIVTME
jgi:hypothetical protein